jgi:undecaprenyl-diphosphatase
MLILKASFLAILQALTEFLPISSSGHLAIAQKLFDLTQFNLSFDVLIHLGSALALIVVFWRDWVKIFKDGFKDFKSSLLLKIIIGIIPAGIAGLAFNHFNINLDNTIWLIAIDTFVFGFILWWADAQKGQSKISGLNFSTVIIIGLAQCLALSPGVSRSGVTMIAALFLGLSREESARFSFLLSAPIILGANLVELPKLVHLSSNLISPYLIGLLVSFVASWLVVTWFLNYLKRNRLWPFAVYRLILGLTLIVLLLAKII